MNRRAEKVEQKVSHLSILANGKYDIIHSDFIGIHKPTVMYWCVITNSIDNVTIGNFLWYEKN